MQTDPHDDPRNRPPIEGEFVETTEVMRTAGQALVANPDMDAGLAIALSEAEINQQIATAKRYPRSIQGALDEIVTLATLDTPTAIECNYSLPRGKDQNGKAKTISGPSIRLAELIAQSWGNNRVAARVIAVDRKEKFIEAEGIYHDLEKNTAVCARVRRRISDSKGRLYSDDMIVVTGNAASSIALRNAILRGVPKPIWRGAYQKVLAVIAGDEKTIAARRVEILEAFKRDLNVPAVKVFAALGVKGVNDIGPDEVITLAGFYTALKNNEVTLDDLIQETASAQPGGKSLGAAYGGEQGRPAAQGGAQSGGDGQPAGDSQKPAKAAQAAAKPAGDADKKAADPKPEEPTEAAPKETIAGSPPADEIYLLRGDGIDGDGKRPTYKNGEAFSRVSPKGVAKLIEYTAHPGAPADDKSDDDQDQAQADAGEGAEQVAAEADQDDAAEETGQDTAPAAEQGAVEVFSEFEDAVDQADDWPAIRTAWLALIADPAFEQSGADTRADARAYGWNRAVEFLTENEQDPRANVVLFDLWLAVARPNEIKPAFRALIGTGEYRALSESEKDRIGDAVTVAVGE